MHRDILIISDIEGSSGCFDYESSSFKTEKWAAACIEMSLDVNSVVSSLFDAGAENVTVKDFHRTGYNLLPELIDTRAKLIFGYKRGDVPGIGSTGSATALMMIGMHASSGSGDFLAHTMTSRISSLKANDRQLSEGELFSSSMAHKGIAPVFFSGSPEACTELKNAIPACHLYPIDKTDPLFNIQQWRTGLAETAVKSLSLTDQIPFHPEGPFSAEITMRDGGHEAAKLGKRWGYKYKGDTLYLVCETIDDLYYSLIRLCYLTPFVEKILPVGLPLYNLYGLYGRFWVRKRVRDRIRLLKKNAPVS